MIVWLWCARQAQLYVPYPEKRAKQPSRARLRIQSGCRYIPRDIPRIMSLSCRPYWRSRKLLGCMSPKSNGIHCSNYLKLDSDSYLIAIDNCCSYSMSNSRDDFVGQLTPCDVNIKGIGGDNCIRESGLVKWTIADDEGKPYDILIPGTYYNPKSPYRLWSPQHWAQTSDNPIGVTCLTTHNSMVLTDKAQAFKRTITLDRNTNCGFVRSVHGNSNYRAFMTLFPLSQEPTCFMQHYGLTSASTNTRAPEGANGINNESSISADLPAGISPFDPQDKNCEDSLETLEQEQQDEMTKDCDEMLRIHYKLGHLSFAKIKFMATVGWLDKRLSSCSIPKCAGCLYGKATRRPWRVKGQVSQILKSAAPGDVVFIDQLTVSTPGLIGQTSGFLTHSRYHHATLFLDHFSDCPYIVLQKGLTGEETVRAKARYEGYARRHGVKVKHYHTDNGIFRGEMFTEDIRAQRQTMSHCGVGAHHQNGRVEKLIRDTQDHGRTVLLHAQQRWPNAVCENLWPYAFALYVEIRKWTPRAIDGKVPYHLFCRSGEEKPHLKHLHTFGCPAFVLNKVLQNDTSKLSKLSNRSRVGVYLGPSPNHASSVHMILSLQTGHVSPQFHVYFDDMFETVRSRVCLPQSNWQYKTGLWNSTNTHGEARAYLPARGSINQEVSTRGHTASSANCARELLPTREQTDYDTQDVGTDTNHQAIDEETATNNSTEQETLGPTEAGQQEDNNINSNDPSSNDQENANAPRLWSRRHKPTARLREYMGTIQSMTCLNEALHQEDLTFLNGMDNPLCFMISKSDTLYYDQAMQVEDKEKFQEAMMQEVKTHFERKHWELIALQDVPPSTKLLDSVWAMRRKRRISTGEIYKYKARLNAHGGQQVHGVHYWDTYAPVVTWFAIRLMLTLVLLHKWSTLTVDFVLAYPQADVDSEIYIKLPRGVNFGPSISRLTHVLKLIKNIYGLKQAGRVWNKHLHKGLIKLKFQQSAYDACIYYRGSVVMGVYIDDCLIIAPSDAEVLKVYTDLQAEFEVTNEGPIDEYLGVKVERRANHTMKLSQPLLIQQILEEMGFNQRTKGRTTPALSSQILNRDCKGTQKLTTWDYRSILGKLNYLEKSTRPDIAYAVHQCARFAADPKESHVQAMLRIGRYLHATREKGLIYNPQAQSFDVWCDADFSGNWMTEAAHNDSSTAKSRTGYLITFANCPIAWTSKLQTEIALSTTEAEFIALSEGLRSTIPLIGLVTEFREKGVPMILCKPKIHCRVFEDNNGAIELAQCQKYRPRTKHINIKYWHFMDYVTRYNIEILPVDTKEQLADIFTKPLPQETFERLRDKVQGID